MGCGYSSVGRDTAANYNISTLTLAEWLQPVNAAAAVWMQGMQGTSRATKLSYVVANLFRNDLQPDFRLPARARFVLAGEEDVRMLGESGEFDRRFPHNYGYVAVSAVGFNHDLTEAVDHFCGLW